MKFGYRTPSISKSFKARTTGRAKRSIKRAVNPLYGKKGMGWINNPKKAAYNKVYNRTTKSVLDSGSTGRSGKVNEVTGLNAVLINAVSVMKEVKESLQTINDALVQLSHNIDALNNESCKIIRNKAFKVFAVLAVISNPYLLLIVAPAYGVYRLCIKNRKVLVNKHKSTYSIK